MKERIEKLERNGEGDGESKANRLNIFSQVSVAERESAFKFRNQGKSGMLIS